MLARVPSVNSSCCSHSFRRIGSGSFQVFLWDSAAGSRGVDGLDQAELTPEFSCCCYEAEMSRCASDLFRFTLYICGRCLRAASVPAAVVLLEFTKCWPADASQPDERRCCPSHCLLAPRRSSRGSWRTEVLKVQAFSVDGRSAF